MRNLLDRWLVVFDNIMEAILFGTITALSFYGISYIAVIILERLKK